MRHKVITEIKTGIRVNRKGKPRMLVIVGMNEEYIFIESDRLISRIELAVFELELLIGSKIRFEYYQLGEKINDDVICEKDNSIVKDFFIELKSSLSELRELNSQYLMPFQRISKVFYFNKFDKDSVGIETEDGSVIFLKQDRWDGICKLEKENQKILVGSFIHPIYLKKGDKFSDGTIVRNEKMLAKLILRLDFNFINSDSNDEYDDDNGLMGYDSWSDMSFYEAYDGDVDAWNNRWD